MAESGAWAEHAGSPLARNHKRKMSHGESPPCGRRSDLRDKLEHAIPSGGCHFPTPVRWEEKRDGLEAGGIAARDVGLQRGRLSIEATSGDEQLSSCGPHPVRLPAVDGPAARKDPASGRPPTGRNAHPNRAIGVDVPILRRTSRTCVRIGRSAIPSDLRNETCGPRCLRLICQ